MSQEKVDKRKYEKKNRKALEKKRKRRTMIKWITVAVIIGIIIGVPSAVSIYHSIPKFVGDSVFSAYISNYIDEKYADDVALLNSASDTDEDSENAEEDATETDSDNTEEDTQGQDADNTDETDSENSEAE